MLALLEKNASDPRIVLNGEAAGANRSFGVFGEANPSTGGPGVKPPVMYGWQGLAYDAESGLWNNGVRTYSPNLGTFMSQDPMGVDGGINLYGSRNNNPLIYTDPFGMTASLPTDHMHGGPPIPGGGLGRALAKAAEKAWEWFKNSLKPPKPLSVAERAAAISKQINKNSVTIKYEGGHTRYDLRGAAHWDVETPHLLRYKRNVNPRDPSKSNIGPATNLPERIRMEDLDLVEEFLLKNHPGYIKVKP